MGRAYRLLRGLIKRAHFFPVVLGRAGPLGSGSRERPSIAIFGNGSRERLSGAPLGGAPQERPSEAPHASASRESLSGALLGRLLAHGRQSPGNSCECFGPSACLTRCGWRRYRFGWACCDATKVRRAHGRESLAPLQWARSMHGDR